MCVFQLLCEKIINPYFEKRAKDCARKDFLKFKKSLKNIIVSNGLNCDIFEILSSKHDFDEKISYSFIIKRIRESEKRIKNKNEYPLLNIIFEVTSYPIKLREECKDIYMETFESAINIGHSWDFDTIVKLPLSIFENI